MSLDRVRAHLAPHPHLAEAFERLFAALVADDAGNDVAILASGSLAHGGMDARSDLDLEIVVAADADSAAVRARIDDTLAAIGTPLCRFPADHLGLDDLLVSFHDFGGRIVKIDVWVMPPAGLAFLPKAVVLHDPRGLASTRPPAAHPSRDLDDLAAKFCGWMWFTHVKIARGHFLEAAESLEIMRSFALLPFLHAAGDLPREGFRLLEERLPPAHLAHLHRTYPRAHDAVELGRALDEMTALFLEVAGAPRSRCAARMRDLIAADRRTLTSPSAPPADDASRSGSPPA